MNDSARNSRRGRWFQFRLQTLLALILIVGAYFGGFVLGKRLGHEASQKTEPPPGATTQADLAALQPAETPAPLVGSVVKAPEETGHRFPFVVSSTDGTTLVALVCGDASQDLVVWTPGKEQRLRTPISGTNIQHLLLSADGKTIVTVDVIESFANGGTPPKVPAVADVREAATGTKVASLTIDTLPLWSAAISPDGKLLATATGDNWRETAGKLTLWDIQTKSKKRTLDVDGAVVTAVAFSPDGQSLVVGIGHPHRCPEVATDVRVLNATTLEEQTRLRGHLTGVRCATFSGDGKILATLGEHEPIKLWDTATWKLLATVEDKSLRYGSVDGMALSRDGKFLATGQGFFVQIWDVLTGQARGAIRAPRFFGRVESLSFCDNQHLAVATDQPREFPWIVDVTTGIDLDWPGCTELTSSEKRQYQVLVDNAGGSGRELVFERAFGEGEAERIAFVFDPVFKSWPGSQPQTVIVTDAKGQVLTGRVVGGSPMYKHADLQKTGDQWVLAITCRERGFGAGVYRYVLSDSSIRPIHFEQSAPLDLATRRELERLRERLTPLGR